MESQITINSNWPRNFKDNEPDDDYIVRKNTAKMFSMFGAGLGFISQNSKLNELKKPITNRWRFTICGLTSLLCYGISYSILKNIYEI